LPFEGEVQNPMFHDDFQVHKVNWHAASIASNANVRAKRRISALRGVFEQVTMAGTLYLPEIRVIWPEGIMKHPWFH
jgi:hypothetical protein